MTFDLIKTITDKCYAKNAETSEIGRQKQRIEATVTVLLLPTDYIHILYIGRIYTILWDIWKSYVIWGK